MNRWTHLTLTGRAWRVGVPVSARVNRKLAGTEEDERLRQRSLDLLDEVERAE